VMSRLTGSYVIDGGGSRRGPKPVPHYVIDGGGGAGGPQPQRPAGVVGVRGRAPGSGIRVGVVDTRLAQHPWLAGGYVAPADELLPVHSDSTLPWQAQHATFVTGLILRQAPGAVVELRSGLDDHATTDSWTVARVIADLADGATDVVNLSLGCSTEDGRPPLVLSAALAALGPRTVVVAAAGNHGTVAAPVPCWPAALDNVIAVGALDDGGAAAFSPEAPWVDAMAPGVDVVSTSTVDGEDGALFARWSGTSFAAAAVTGAIAAGTIESGSAGQAWDRLRHDAPKDAHGRPKVALRHVSGWPPDNPPAKGEP
jgi:membrane-anchored mycosin MYCP